MLLKFVFLKSSSIQTAHTEAIAARNIRNSQTQDDPFSPRSQINPIHIAKISPPNYPVIIRVPVITLDSIGNVNSDEKLIPIGIIGTRKTPIIITFIEIKHYQFMFFTKKTVVYTVNAIFVALCERSLKDAKHSTSNIYV